MTSATHIFTGHEQIINLTAMRCCTFGMVSFYSLLGIYIYVQRTSIFCALMGLNHTKFVEMCIATSG